MFDTGHTGHRSLWLRCSGAAGYGQAARCFAAGEPVTIPATPVTVRHLLPRSGRASNDSGQAGLRSGRPLVRSGRASGTETDDTGHGKGRAVGIRGRVRTMAIAGALLAATAGTAAAQAAGAGGVEVLGD